MGFLRLLMVTHVPTVCLVLFFLRLWYLRTFFQKVVHGVASQHLYTGLGVGLLRACDSELDLGMLDVVAFAYP